MEDILAKIIASKAVRLEAAKKHLSPADAEAKARAMGAPAYNLLDILKTPSPHGMHVIAEIKKASPSKGVLREDFHPLNIAQAYLRGGATALSILTEQDHFQGSDDYLREVSGLVSLPTLRKDFLTEAYQIFEAKLLGASAYLLIVSCLEESKLRDLIALGLELGLTPLTEVHDEAETETALRAGAPLIGVNNRNLRTFEISLNTTFRLRKMVPKEIPFVSESGIFVRQDILALEAEGVNAVLVGESLMRDDFPEDKLRSLLGIRD